MSNNLAQCMSGDNRMSVGGPVLRAGLMILVLLGLSIAAILYFLDATAKRENRLSEISQTHLVETALEGTISSLTNRVSDVSFWDEAVSEVSREEFDNDWGDDYIGVYYNEAFGIDGSFILSPDRQQIYAYTPDLEQLTFEGLLGHYAESFFATLQDAGMHFSYSQYTFVEMEGEVFLVAGAPVTPEDPTAEQLEPAPRSVIVLFQKLSEGMLADISDKYLVDRLHVVDMEVDLEERVALEIKNIDGMAIGRLAWFPARPGDDLMRDLFPKLILICSMLLLFAIATLYFWTRSIHEASAAKTLFLGKVSHELRTPINPIVGFADAMAHEIRGPLPEPYKEYARDIAKSGRLLAGLVEDLLDVTKVESGALRLDETRIDVKSLVDSVCQAFSIRPQERDGSKRVGEHMTVSCAFSDPLPALRGDERRIRQILMNLLTNAERHSGGSEVMVDVSAPDGAIVVSVRDNGIGIAEKDIGALFQPFSQLGHTKKEEPSTGAGLGLVLSRELMRLHDGDLTLVGGEGTGAEFRMIFPPERSVS